MDFELDDPILIKDKTKGRAIAPRIAFNTSIISTKLFAMLSHKCARNLSEMVNRIIRNFDLAFEQFFNLADVDIFFISGSFTSFYSLILLTRK